MGCADEETDPPRTMRDCLAERLAILATAIPDLQTWYDDGADLDTLDVPPVAVREAYAYLEGAADMADLTVMMLLDEHGLSLATPTGPTRTRAIIVVRNVGATGRPAIMRPFYECVDGSRWAVPRTHERTALQREGQAVMIEIRSPDDQFAYPV